MLDIGRRLAHPALEGGPSCRFLHFHVASCTTFRVVAASRTVLQDLGSGAARRGGSSPSSCTDIQIGELPRLCTFE